MSLLVDYQWNKLNLKSTSFFFFPGKSYIKNDTMKCCVQSEQSWYILARTKIASDSVKRTVVASRGFDHGVNLFKYSFVEVLCGNISSIFKRKQKAVLVDDEAHLWQKRRAPFGYSVVILRQIGKPYPTDHGMEALEARKKALSKSEINESDQGLAKGSYWKMFYPNAWKF